MSEPSWMTSTRQAYDTVAVDYERVLRDSLAGAPLDRAALAGFAELVLTAGGGPVLDLGCGPGRLTGYLQGLGLTVSGLDLSPGMVRVARHRHPDVEFSVGTMTALQLPDASLGGVLAWYSLIHLPAAELPGVFAQLYRVLVPGGQLLTAFQVGDEVVHLEQAYGHAVSADAYRRSPEQLTELMTRAGLVVDATLVRAAQPLEKTPQAFLFAHRP